MTAEGPVEVEKPVAPDVARAMWEFGFTREQAEALMEDREDACAECRWPRLRRADELPAGG